MKSITWHYRICKHTTELGEWYGLHDAYSEPGTQTPHSITARALVVGESPEEIIAAIEQMLHDAKGRPVFDVPKDWDNVT